MQFDLILDIEKGANRFSTIENPITLRQQDAIAYTIVASIRQAGEILDLNDKEVRFYALRPDGHEIIDGDNVTILSAADGTIRYDIPKELTLVAGDIPTSYFRITDGGWSASTENLAIQVIPSIVIQTSGGDYIPELDAILAEMEFQKENYDQAESERETSWGIISADAAEKLDFMAQAHAREQVRISNETERLEAESARLAAEAERASAEDARAAAEAERDAAEALRIAAEAERELLAHGWLRHYCTEDEIDPVTGEPAVDDPNPATLYFTPIDDPISDNMWEEWVDADGSWERLGTTNSVVDPITSEDIVAMVDDDETLTGSQVLNKTGLSLFFSKLKAFFARKVHTHSASDITSGTLDVARIADNSIPSTKFDQNTQDSLFRELWGEGGNRSATLWRMTDYDGAAYVLFATPTELIFRRNKDGVVTDFWRK